MQSTRVVGNISLKMMHDWINSSKLSVHTIIWDVETESQFESHYIYNKVITQINTSIINSFIHS